MAHASSLFSGHFPGAAIPSGSSTNPAAPILPIRPRILGETDRGDVQVHEWEDPPWADFDKWSNLGQQNQQEVLDRLEAEMKWGPPLGMAASLLAPFPFGAVGPAIGTGIGMGAAKDLFEIQHGRPSGWKNPQWSFWDALNPFGGANPAEQLSRNVMDFESSILASPPSAPPGWSGPGWSGLGIPDDIQIEYGGSRSEGEIRDLIDKARIASGLRGQQEALAYRDDWKMGSGDAPVPEIRRQPEAIIAQREIMDQIPHMLSPEDKAKRDEAWDRAAQLIEQTATLDWDAGGGDDPDDADMGGFDMSGGADEENYGDFNTGGPVIKRRGFRETATSPLAAGSFIDKPLYDRAVDTSPTYRRW